MDSFFEQIIKRKKTAADWLLTVLIVLLALAALLAAFIFAPSFFFILAVGIGYGTWWLVTNMNVEYEYCVTNGDIDVDQITARRKRKRLVSVAGRKIESLQPYDPSAPLGKYDRRVMAASSPMAQGLWCFSYHSKKNGHTFVVFQPDERILRSFYEGLPKLVQMDTDRAARDLGIDLKTKHHGEE